MNKKVITPQLGKTNSEPKFCHVLALSCCVTLSKLQHLRASVFSSVKWEAHYTSSHRSRAVVKASHKLQSALQEGTPRSLWSEWEAVTEDHRRDVGRCSVPQQFRAECPMPTTPTSPAWKSWGFTSACRKSCVCGAAVPSSSSPIYSAKFQRPPWKKVVHLTTNRFMPSDRDWEHRNHSLSCLPGPGNKPTLAALPGPWRPHEWVSPWNWGGKVYLGMLQFPRQMGWLRGQ